MKKLKTIIIIIIIIIICIIALLFLLNKNNNIYNEETKNDNVSEVENASEFDLKQQTDLTQVTEESLYYNGLHYIKYYLDTLNYDDSEKVYNILYKGELKNIENKGLSIHFKKAYYRDFDIEHSLYIYQGQYVDNNNIKDYYCGVLFDYKNMTYAIINGNSIEEINAINSNYNIEKNEDNEYSFYNESDENICREILNNIKFNIKYNPEEIYNSLNEEYRLKRFKDKEDYYKYVENIQENLSKGSFIKYESSYEGKSKVYRIINQYNMNIIIKQNSIIDFNIMLDNYTILDNNYISKYNSLDNESKAHTNVDLFIRMINTKDYERAYEKLNSTFRDNNFGSVENFENYINSNFYNYGILSVERVEQRGDVYVVETRIYNDASVQATSINKDFIVKLNDGTNFELSFNI